MSKKPERRVLVASQIEARELDGSAMTLAGYAARFDSPSEPLPFIERIQRGAFRKTLSESPDVRFLSLNHDGMPLARTKSGTLTLTEDEVGLHFVANLPDTNEARELYTAVQRGDISEMSFAFRVIRQSWNEDRSQRTLIEISLVDGDVSPVTYPAYKATTVEARAKVLRELENVRTSPDADVEATQAAFEKARSAIAELIALEAGELAMGEDEQGSLNFLMEAANALLNWESWEECEEPTDTPDAPESTDPTLDPMEMNNAPRKISLRLAQAINNK